MSDGESEAQFLERILLGDQDAVTYCLLLGQITQIIDDLYDRDKPVGNDTIVRTFWQALVALPCNTFYQEHFTILQPQFQQVYFDWMTANQFEGSGDDHGLNLAFVLRDNVDALVVTAARMVGGFDHAQAVAPEIRRRFSDGSLASYKEEHAR